VGGGKTWWGREQSVGEVRHGKEEGAGDGGYGVEGEQRRSGGRSEAE